jgi:hypothetical protein
MMSYFLSLREKIEVRASPVSRSTAATREHLCGSIFRCLAPGRFHNAPLPCRPRHRNTAGFVTDLRSINAGNDQCGRHFGKIFVLKAFKKIF